MYFGLLNIVYANSKKMAFVDVAQKVGMVMNQARSVRSCLYSF